MFEKKIRLVPVKINEEDFTEQDLINVPDSFLVEIKCVDVLEYSSDNKLLDLICKKLRKDGKLYLTGIDGLDLCRRTHYGNITLERASEIFREMKNLNSVLNLKRYFLNDKWNISFAGLKDGNYSLEVTRVK